MEGDVAEKFFALIEVFGAEKADSDAFARKSNCAGQSHGS